MMTFEQLKAKMTAGIGVLGAIASITPNSLDDEVVEFLRYLVQDTETVYRAYVLFQTARGNKVK